MRMLVLSMSVIFGFSPIFAQTIINSKQPWGAVRNGMRMAVSAPLRTTEHHAAFYVAFQNVGSNDTVLNLGLMWANGKVSEPSAVLLVFTDPTGQKTGLSCLRSPAMSGRLDDFIVAVPAGATYVLKIKMDQCRSPVFPTLKLNAGRYRIAARFEGKEAQFVNLDMQGMRSLKFWKGVLESNSQQFELATEP